MHPLRELLKLTRLAHAELSVWQYMRDLERARSGLAKSIIVRDQIMADIRAGAVVPTPSVPEFLLKQPDANVQPIARGRKA